MMHRRTLLLILLLCLVAPMPANSNPHGFDNLTEINQFINEMVREHEFDLAELQVLFSQVRMHQSILDAISRPAERRPWHEYRPIFVNRDRIAGGVRFMRKHGDTLQRVEKVYGVPPQIVTAIIGVETRYGQHTGQFPVIDALSTLAFAYPPRSSFFRKELEHYLLMTREEGLDPLQQKGSYAGAMGMPQFISSSFRNYAVDFDGDGKRDLWDNPVDAMGSVGNYFKQHRWIPGQPVAHRVKVHGDRYEALLSNDLRPRLSQQELLENGVVLSRHIPADLNGALIRLDSAEGPEYWVVWHNFYVISRYNRSALYSMAVYQLSEQIRAASD